MKVFYSLCLLVLAAMAVGLTQLYVPAEGKDSLGNGPALGAAYLSLIGAGIAFASKLIDPR